MGIKSSLNETMSITFSIQRVRQTPSTFLLVSGGNNSMHSRNKSCLDSKKSKKYYNYFFVQLYLKHTVFCRFYKCLNLVHEKINECIWLFNFWLLHELSCNFYSQKHCSLQPFMYSFNSERVLIEHVTEQVTFAFYLTCLM